MRAATLAAIGKHRCTAILRTTKACAVRPALDAAIAGGFRILEITMSTPGVLYHVARLRKEDPSLVLGIGTILSQADAQQAKEAGAQFLVSPVVQPWMLEYCKENGLVAWHGIPSAHWDCGKVSNCPFRMLTHELARTQFLSYATLPPPIAQGSHPSNAFEAGCQGVGFVADLFPAREVQSGKFDVIASRARGMTALVNELKEKFPTLTVENNG